QDALVGDKTAFSLEENREISIQQFRDVVRVQNRNLGGFGQPFASHHADIHPRNRKNAGAAVRGGHDRANAIRYFGFRIADCGESRQKLYEMCADADWSDPGAAAAMRNAESLMQIQVANICANVAGAAKTDLG